MPDMPWSSAPTPSYHSECVGLGDPNEPSADAIREVGAKRGVGATIAPVVCAVALAPVAMAQFIWDGEGLTSLWTDEENWLNKAI